ncbi:MAG: helix-turn-helix transcriptional regulator [Treponema sp.]|nr:helix-turn-helix transcriptional regulator [Treponema sp.]MBQ6567367.1 helix-turn-helix transcriptional regulator [Treponema sp.]MBQ7166872.1 helix-turn-helix transcriptional regulator [Treponema sp.]
MEFWNNVEELRAAQHTSYRWISQKTGLPETTISSMRNSGTEPRASDAIKLASALGTTVEFLCTKKEEKSDSYYEKYSCLKTALTKVLETY